MQKRTLKTELFVSFSGSVFGPPLGLPFGGFLERLAPQKLAFRLGGPSKTLLPPSRPQERKKREKITKMTAKIEPKTIKKRSQKWGPKKIEKGTQHLKTLAPFFKISLGLGVPSEDPALLYHLLNKLFSLHFVQPLRSRPHTTDHPHDYDFPCIFAWHGHPATPESPREPKLRLIMLGSVFNHHF